MVEVSVVGSVVEVDKVDTITNGSISPSKCVGVGTSAAVAAVAAVATASSLLVIGSSCCCCSHSCSWSCCSCTLLFLPHLFVGLSVEGMAEEKRAGISTMPCGLQEMNTGSCPFLFTAGMSVIVDALSKCRSCWERRANEANEVLK